MAKRTTQAEPPESEQAQGGGQPGGKITKVEAVRRALAELGNDAKPAQMQGWIREHLGIEMTADHISTTKGDILRKAGLKGKPAGKKKPATPKPAARKTEAQEEAPGPRVHPAPSAPKGGNGKAGGIPLEDILVVRELVGRLGAGPLHTLIDAFSR